MDHVAVCVGGVLCVCACVCEREREGSTKGGRDRERRSNYLEFFCVKRKINICKSSSVPFYL